MNESQPPPIPIPRARKSGTPTWAMVLIGLSIAGVVGIALIGMLAAIAVPNFVRARDTAQRNACINNLRMIDGAKQAWALESKQELGSLPTGANLSPYLKSGFDVLRCPRGGDYEINPTDLKPSCSIPNHQSPPE